MPRSLPIEVAIAGLCIWVFCVSGYWGLGFAHYKSLAKAERVAAQRTERANAELQVAVDRLRNGLMDAGARIDIASMQLGSGLQDELVSGLQGQLGSGLQDELVSGLQGEFVSSLQGEDRSDRFLELGQTFEPLDRARPDMWSPISTEVSVSRSIVAAMGHLQQTWARITLDPPQANLQQVNADYDAVSGERDQLRQRIGELEQQLALLEQQQAAPQAAKPPQDDTSRMSSARNPGTSIAFPDTAGAGRNGEAAQAVKNFNTPASAPDYFNNESGAILRHSGTAVERR